MLKIYNNLTKQKEELKPLIPGKVGIYVCGITVYDYCHIGHARLLVAFDVITRYLRAKGYQICYVRNITDIDDKIINRSNENGEEFTRLTERFIQAAHEDERALNVLPPDIEPRSTDYIPAMIEMIERLITKGFAYVAENGDVYYKVSQFKSYGELAHQDMENLRAGARVDILDAKHDPLDFALWKLAKPNEPSWDSPWGKGRPGWHIECSAMATQVLGEHFDIHGGGLDLVFPHHQNELAQSEAASGKKFVNIWTHNGLVQINREKMSKSLNNFFTIREVLAQYQPEVVRYFLLASHYRSPINYSAENLQSARAALERFYLCLRDVNVAVNTHTENEYTARFNEVMDDDFNTPEALAVMFDLVREINRLQQEKQLDKAAQLAGVLKKLGATLGLLQQQPADFLQAGADKQEVQLIEQLIAERNAARRSKSWQEADRIRAQLSNMGINLEDNAQGTSWRREVKVNSF